MVEEIVEEVYSRIQVIERALQNYRENRTNIEDLETDVMYIKERLEKLENLSDFKKLEACVIDGAQTHLTVLKLEKRLEKIENHFSGDYQLVATKLTPHKCPNCNFSGVILLETDDELDRYCKQRMRTDDGKWFIWCKACEGNGIVWG